MTGDDLDESAEGKERAESPNNTARTGGTMLALLDWNEAASRTAKVWRMFDAAMDVTDNAGHLVSTCHQAQINVCSEMCVDPLHERGPVSSQVMSF